MKGILLFIAILFSLSLIAQNNLGVKFFGLSTHPKGEKENAFLMPNKLDRNGYLVMNFGGAISYEYFIYENKYSLKTVQALYSDCATRLGGFTHIGLRSKILRKGRHTISGGIGPTIIYRKNWLELKGYVNQNRFKGNEGNKWQYLFLWYGGEFEYKYSLNEKFDLSVSFVPGYPDLMNLSFGINKKL